MKLAEKIVLINDDDNDDDNTGGYFLCIQGGEGGLKLADKRLS